MALQKPISEKIKMSRARKIRREEERSAKKAIKKGLSPQPEVKHPTFKRYVLPVVAVGIIATASFGLLRNKESKLEQELKNSSPIENSIEDTRIITFNEAKLNNNLRQQYIEQMIEQYPAPVDDLQIVYFSDKNFEVNPLFEKDELDGGAVLKAISTPRPGGDKKWRLEIYGNAINLLNSQDEFISGLDHEYSHIELGKGVYVKGDETVIQELRDRCMGDKGDLVEVFNELCAYSNQIKKFKERTNLSEGYKNKIIQSYNLYRDSLKEKPQTPLTETLLETYPKR